MPGNKCSNCMTYNHECTYVEAAKKRGPPKGYVESLENRLQKMEGLLHKLCPDADFSAELGGQLEKDNWYSDRGEKGPSMSSTTSPIPPAAPDPNAEDLVPSDDEIIAQRDLIRNFKQMDLNSSSHMRFFGKSSSVMFIQTAIEAKHEYAGLDMPKRREQGWWPILPSKRPQFWGVHPWILGAIHQPKPKLVFPPQDLLDDLTEVYFTKINSYQPLLHRPTFEDNMREGLHERDEGFGSVVLLVCAAAARFSDDPRVFLQGTDSTHSSGWEWFRQLTAMFLQSTSAPQACWTVIGVGIRLAQDVGAHRRKVYQLSSTVDQELWKRAFWVLVSMDRAMSMTLGRPCAIQDEDFDVELPVECDDEYWEISENPNPEKSHKKIVAFKQPAGKPSKITYFNCFLRLNQILAFALRTIYSINKSKALLGFVGTQWEQHIVAELDSALNKWIDSVPDHLRWDPNREDLLFLNQSASLYAHYYQLQIAVHRPFIPSPRKPSPLTFPSLAICTNAARSCTHVLDVPFRRTNNVISANMESQMALFTSGIVLLLNIWGGKRSGLSTDPAKEMADVHKCMKMLKKLEPRWHTAGRLWDVLYELASVGDLPLPQSSPSPSNKRDREDEEEGGEVPCPMAPPTPASMTSTPDSNFAPSPSDRQMAGSRRVSELQARHSQQSSQPLQAMLTPPSSYQPSPHTSQSPMSQPPTHVPSQFVSPAAPATASGMASHTNYGLPNGLPMTSADLGRMPLHPSLSTDCLATHWASLATNGLPQTATAASAHAPSPYQSGPSMFAHAGPSSAATAGPSSSGPAVDVAGAPPMPGSFEQVMSTMTGAPFVSSIDGYANVVMDTGMGGPDAAMDMGTGVMGSGTFGMGMADATGGVFTDSDTLAMWSNAPQGFEWDDWGAFVSHGLGPQGGGGPGGAGPSNGSQL
ncbi:hypothetical protein EIP91_006814 [Steccherinum ochraceum]|uniref:Xylanolytic transcriptional activator regulatory domain-containing protein n=1 Tax=Steccherinum ochraceum TaxID=92696 RepID=A0A4R0R7U5_9APHY|nr:hypothetical protein EIP91_006814 [Steccherinum ochraceum]